MQGNYSDSMLNNLSMKSAPGNDVKSIIGSIRNIGTTLRNISSSSSSSNVSSGNQMILSSSSSFKGQVTKSDYVYIIKDSFNLNNESVTLPLNSTLIFQGGSLSNGTIIGSNSSISANYKIFNNINVKGTWKCPGNVCWYANGCSITENNNVCSINSKTSESTQIQLALDSAFRELIFPPIPYYIGTSLVLSMEKKLILQGSNMYQSLESCRPNIKNTSILFTDKNIPILIISVTENTYQNTVDVLGGNFDVSLCSNYSESCIKVLADNNQKIWGLNINTNVHGKYNNELGFGINLNPSENRNMSGNKAYITQIRINSNVSNFGTGVKATNYMDSSTGVYYNWCTDLVIDGAIINCPLAIDTNVDCDIRAMLQAGYYFSSSENGKGLVKFNGVRGSICSNVYDITLNSGGKYANQYAVECGNEARLVPYGLFHSFLIEGRWLNKPIVKGPLYNVQTSKIYTAVA